MKRIIPQRVRKASERPPLWRSGVLGALVLAAVWGVLTGSFRTWAVGLPVVLLCIAANLLLPPRRAWRFRLRGAVAFVPYFLVQSVRSGFDVAVRAMRPSLPLSQKFIRYRLRLPDGPSRVFFANCISLLPGTLSCRFEPDAVRVHVLFWHGRVRADLERLEGKVAALFGESR